VFVPSYEQLLKAELEQVAYFSPEATKARADESDEYNSDKQSGGIAKENSKVKKTDFILEELA